MSKKFNKGGRKGAPAGGYRADGGSVESQLQGGLENFNPETYAALFTMQTGLARRLRDELGAGGVEALNKRLAWCGTVGGGVHAKLSAVVACMAHAAGEQARGNATAAHDAMLDAVKNMNQYLDDVTSENCPRPAWMIAFLGPLLHTARVVAMDCEKAEGAAGKRVDDVASAARNTFTKIVSDRSPVTKVEDSKKRGLLIVANVIAKASFYRNNMGFVRPIYENLRRMDEQLTKKPLSQGGFGQPLIAYGSLAQQVAYYYFSGRVAMLDQEFAKAEEYFTTALKLCHTGYRKNVIRILTFLVTVKLVQGKFPNPALLRQYGLDGIFQPIVEAMQQGQVASFDAVMEQYASFFAKLGLYVVLHRARVMCYLTLIRRVHHARCLVRPDDSNYTTRIKIPLLMDAFEAANGKGISQEEVECALVCLIANKQILGYISLKHDTVVLKKQGSPFPTFPK